MRLKNMWKRFGTLDVHNHAGFTLVELIIVIAILAILSTGAIAGYSAYVESANKTADKALVSEIVNVLTMHAYANGIGEGGYVVLSPNGDAKVNGEAVEKALIDAYGENWASALKLKYASWTNDGLLDYVLQNADSASLVANSTFLTTATPDGLMNAVTNLTDAASTVINNYSGDVETTLKGLLGQEFVDKLNATGYTAEDDEYETVISNMLVGHFSEQLKDSSFEEIQAEDNGGMLSMVLVYAEMYAYCETVGDTTTMGRLNEYLAGANSTENLSVAGLMGCLEEGVQAGTVDQNFMADFEKFVLNEDGTPGQGATDVEAALKILGAVDHVADTYTKEELANPDLYSSDVVSEQLNNYINAVKAVASGMDVSNLNAGANDVTIFVAEDGSVAVLPESVYLGN